MPLSISSEQSDLAAVAGHDSGCCKCKWCKRFQTDAQPLHHLRDRYPTICWRRRGGRECSICPVFISQDAEYKNVDRNQLLDKIDGDDAEQKKYDEKREKYEADKNKNGGRVRSTPSSTQTVTARSSAILESRRFQGYFWPSAYWSEVNNGAKLPRAKLSSHIHQGKKLSGSWEKTAGPEPTRAIEVYSIGHNAIDRQAELGSTDHVDLDSLDKVHEAACKRVRAHSSRKPDGTMKVTVGQGNILPGDDDADDAAIDSVFARKSKVQFQQPDEDDETSKASVEQRATPKKPAKPRQPKDKDDAAACSPGHPRPSPGKAWTKATIQKAMDDSEQVVLKCKQFFANFENAKLIVVLTMKGHEALAAAVDRRLTSDLISMYTANYSPTGELADGEADSNSAGMQVFTALRAHQQNLSIVKDFIASLHAKGGFLATAEALKAQYDILKANGINVTDFVLQMVTARAVTRAAENKDSQSIMDLLNPKKSVQSGISELPSDVAASLQKRLFVDHILDYAKVEPDKSKKEGCTKVAVAIEDMRDMVTALPLEADAAGAAYILDASAREELTKLKQVLLAPKMTSARDLENAERARDDLMSRKSGIFHKAVTVFAAGMAARVEADKVFEKLLADKAQKVVLIDLDTKVKSLQKCTVPDCLVTTKVNGVDRPTSVWSPGGAVLVDISKKLALMEASCSQRFLDENTVVLQKIRDAIQDRLVLLKKAARVVEEASVTSATKDIMRVVRDKFKTKSSVAEVVALVDKYAPVPSSEMHCLMELGGKNVMNEYELKVQRYAKFVNLLKDGIPWCAQLFRKDADLISEAGSTFIATVNEFGNVVDQNSDFHALRVEIEGTFSKAVRDEFATRLATMETFVGALACEDLAAIDKENVLLLAAVPAKELKKEPSDEAANLDNISYCAKLSSIATVHSIINGLVAVLKVGSLNVDFSICCMAPHVFRGCRATNEFATAIQHVSLAGLGALEKHLQLVQEVGDAMESLGTSYEQARALGDIMKTFMEKTCFNNLKAWMEKQTASWTEAVQAVTTACKAAGVTDVLGKLENISTDTIGSLTELLDGEDVLTMHEAMKNVRCLEKSADAAHLTKLPTKFGFLEELDLEGFEASREAIFSQESKDLISAGNSLADCTIAQSMLRDLHPGEVRTDLVKKVRTGLEKRKWHAVTPGLEDKLGGVIKKAKKT